MATDHVFEIIVTPDGGTTGQNLVKIINCLDLVSRLPHVVVADVECNGDRTWVQRPPFSASIQEVLEYAQRVGQFDWATFFYFRQALSHASENHQFDALFATADLVVRAVDDTYFYIYSPIEADMSRLEAFFRVQFQEVRRDAVVHPF